MKRSAHILQPASVAPARSAFSLSMGLIDIAWRSVDTPLGQMVVAKTDAGIVRVSFEEEDTEQVLDQLAAAVGARILRDDRALDQAARQMDEYFAGLRREFEMPVDLRLVHGAFRLRAIQALRATVFGERITYSELAERSGNERAVRAAGSACASNPVPIIVPCHRVIKTGGAVGHYAGGPARKLVLLALESPDR